ncbi:Ppx/GppA phosphatase family protein [Aliikangiella coralliicola]|uniref:Ppx/GppA family phosphatase n=1 Tax=Aliikangiella coralliicola TaxID=2592383 RepID=A0A545UHB5_9GAMM|nr:Ppx/GppA phosphatase family protein [Aliikangiella coralliicola]TQV88857.1 Ppx/GppA family phosphatase [Aliikangiella coralliicola]
MQELYATIDLGSNSFHMLTAALVHDEIKILESNSEKVMLAEGLTKKQGIHPQAMQRGLECIARFAQRIENIPPENVRIIGTNTLRAASNAKQFVNQLEKVLKNNSINIVSGIEEARLIYLGVNHSWSNLNQNTKNLVVDIGGGSTEFIVGRNFKLRQAESLRMGCVAFRRFFPENKVTESAFKKAVKAAKFQIANIQKELKTNAWDNVIGSAGTFKAIEKILIQLELSDEGITLKGLKTLKEILLQFDNMDDISIPGLKAPRDQTIIPGVAIALAIFQALKIKKMHISRGGLREGILYDLIGRIKAEDIRQRSISALSQRYHVPEFRSQLLTKISKKLAGNIKTSKSLSLSQENLKFLEWAAQCCRIGLALSHSQYQKHSAYLIKYSELSGFTIKEREVLAAIVKNHRRKLCFTALEEVQISELEIKRLSIVILILRLANIIGQNGKSNQSGHIKIEANSQCFTIVMREKWFAKHHLIGQALELEQDYWRKTGFELVINLKND